MWSAPFSSSRFGHWLWKIVHNADTDDYNTYTYANTTNYDSNAATNDDDTSYYNTIRDTESLCVRD